MVPSRRVFVRLLLATACGVLFAAAAPGTAAERPRDAQGRVWFQLENSTRVALQAAPAGQAPAIEQYAIKVAPFDRAALTNRLRDLGVGTLPSADEPDMFRFEDNNGIVVELGAAG